jgi:quercetin dioxygenase-like cupin family protein
MRRVKGNLSRAAAQRPMYSARQIGECWSEFAYGSNVRVYRLEAFHEVSALPGVGVDLVEMQAHARIPAHVHKDAQVLMYVIGGSGTAELDGKPHALSEGSVVTLDQDVNHAIIANGDGLRFVSVQTPPIYDLSNIKNTHFV